MGMDYVLHENELFRLYGYLKSHELELDEKTYSLLLNIEKKMYGSLTISEIEEIKQKNA